MNNTDFCRLTWQEQQQLRARIYQHAFDELMRQQEQQQHNSQQRKNNKNKNNTPRASSKSKSPQHSPKAPASARPGPSPPHHSPNPLREDSKHIKLWLPPHNSSRYVGDVANKAGALGRMQIAPIEDEETRRRREERERAAAEKRRRATELAEKEAERKRLEEEERQRQLAREEAARQEQARIAAALLELSGKSDVGGDDERAAIEREEQHDAARIAALLAQLKVDIRRFHKQQEKERSELFDGEREARHQIQHEYSEWFRGLHKDFTDEHTVLTEKEKREREEQLRRQREEEERQRREEQLRRLQEEERRNQQRKFEEALARTIAAETQTRQALEQDEETAFRNINVGVESSKKQAAEREAQRIADEKRRQEEEAKRAEEEKKRLEEERARKEAEEREKAEQLLRQKQQLEEQQRKAVESAETAEREQIIEAEQAKEFKAMQRELQKVEADERKRLNDKARREAAERALAEAKAKAEAEEEARRRAEEEYRLECERAAREKEERRRAAIVERFKEIPPADSTHLIMPTEKKAFGDLFELARDFKNVKEDGGMTEKEFNKAADLIWPGHRDKIGEKNDDGSTAATSRLAARAFMYANKGEDGNIATEEDMTAALNFMVYANNLQPLFENVAANGAGTVSLEEFIPIAPDFEVTKPRATWKEMIAYISKELQIELPADSKTVPFDLFCYWLSRERPFFDVELEIGEEDEI